RQLSRKKSYLNDMAELDQLLSKKLADVQRSTGLIQAILEGKEYVQDEKKTVENERKEWMSTARNFAELNPVKKTSKSKPKSSKQKKDAKPDTMQLTVDLFKSGNTIEEIAPERSLVAGSIEGHRAKAISGGIISISDF